MFNYGDTKNLDQLLYARGVEKLTIRRRRLSSGSVEVLASVKGGGLASGVGESVEHAADCCVASLGWVKDDMRKARAAKRKG